MSRPLRADNEKAMKNGAWAALIGGMSFTAAALYLPAVTTGQSLGGQAATTGIAGDLNSRAGANGVNAASRARATAEQMEASRQAFGAQDAKPAEAAMNAKPITPLVTALTLGNDKDLRGQIFEVKGTVLYNIDNGDYKLLALTPNPNDGFPPKVQHLLRFPMTADLKVQEGGLVVMAMAYAGSHHDKENGITTIVFDVPQPGATPGGSAQPGTAPAQEATAPAPAGEFDDPTRGWQAKGTANGLAGEDGTAVIHSPEGKAWYVRAGDELEAGIWVESIEPGLIMLNVNGDSVPVLIW